MFDALQVGDPVIIQRWNWSGATSYRHARVVRITRTQITVESPRGRDRFMLSSGRAIGSVHMQLVPPSQQEAVEAEIRQARDALLAQRAGVLTEIRALAAGDVPPVSDEDALRAFAERLTDLAERLTSRTVRTVRP